MSENGGTAAAARWEALAEELRRRLGAGTPLGPATRARYEAFLGAPLAHAHLHATRLAGLLAAGLGAEALTVGAHVLGHPARLDPATRRGAALLGHELVHVLRRGRPHPTSSPEPVVGDTPPLATGVRTTPGASPMVQRAAEPVAPGPAPAYEEAAAQAVEAEELHERVAPAARGAPSVDVEELAERVYRRIVDDVLLARERANWLA